MAFFSQAMKSTMAPKVKALLKKHGLKGSLSVRNHSTVILTIKSGKIDFIKNCNDTCSKNQYYVDRGFKPTTDGYLDVNQYHYQDHFSGKAKQAIGELLAALNSGNHDNSDAQVDYFDVGWYVDLKIGKWDKPYVLEK